MIDLLTLLFGCVVVDEGGAESKASKAQPSKYGSDKPGKS